MALQELPEVSDIEYGLRKDGEDAGLEVLVNGVPKALLSTDRQATVDRFQPDVVNDQTVHFDRPQQTNPPSKKRKLGKGSLSTISTVMGGCALQVKLDAETQVKVPLHARSAIIFTGGLSHG